MNSAAPPIIGIDASRVRPNEMSGTERYSYRIIKGLLALPTSFRFRLYARSPLPASLAKQCTDVRVIPFPRLWTHVRLAWELRRSPVAVLFVPAHVLPLWCPVPSVVTVHDLGYRYEPEAHTLSQRLYLELTTRWSARRARRIIAISRTTADDLRRYYGIPAERIHIVHHGVDPHFAPRSPDEISAVLRRYGIQGPYLLHVGTLQPRKNLLRLIEAFELLATHDPSLHLVLVGKRGWLRERIERAIETSVARARIHWLGHVADADLPALYSAADVFVFPSLYEGFGLPVLEAMACGTPVVTSARGALSEIAGPALICDPLDPSDIARAIQRARDPALRSRLVRCGFDHAKGFTWERAAQETLAVLTAVIEEQYARPSSVRANSRREDR